MKISQTVLLWLLACGALCGLTAHAATQPGSVWTHPPMWLSDAAATPEFAARLRRSHGGQVERGRDGSMAKRLWLRAGESTVFSSYLIGHEQGSIDYWLTGPDNQTLSIEPFDTGHFGFGMHFPMPAEGFYNAYAIRREVMDGLLRIEAAKAEVLRHSCADGHDYPPGIMDPRPLLPEAPLEIVRARLPGENFHTHLASGDWLEFQVFLRGEPVAGAHVRLISGQDWAKSVITDQAGWARFQMIRDYYPDWEIFNRRREDPLLLVAEYREKTSGEYQGEAYQGIHHLATFTGQYSIPAREYQSYAYGLGLATLAFLIATVWLYLYRRRRWKKPQEEAFDERA